jgi:hypothetical protein
MTTEFWIGLIVALGANIAALGAAWGAFSVRLSALEKKVDKHNNFVERVYKLEGTKQEHDFRLKCLEEKEQ